MSRDRLFTSERELAEFIKEVCEYEDLSQPYRIIKALEDGGYITKVIPYGYVPVLGGDHVDMIRRTCSLILDLIRGNIVAPKENERYYGRRVSEAEVETLIEYAAEHLLTAVPEARDLIKRFLDVLEELTNTYLQCYLLYLEYYDAGASLMKQLLPTSDETLKEIRDEVLEGVEELKKILQKLPIWSLINQVTELLKEYAHNMPDNEPERKIIERLKDLEKRRKELEREAMEMTNKLVELIREFSLGMSTTKLPGVCELCRKVLNLPRRVDDPFEELKSLARRLKESLLTHQWFFVYQGVLLKSRHILGLIQYD